MVMLIKRFTVLIIMLFSMTTIADASSSHGGGHDDAESESIKAKASHDGGGHNKKAAHDSGGHKKTASHDSGHARKASHAAKRSSGHKVHWSYSGHEGPSQWGALSGAYEMCKAGMNQSPINIGVTSEREMDELNFSYATTGLRVLNNGHTIQVNRRGESHMSIAGEDYKLLQFHFHSPSEHHLDGNPYPMEAHFVHQNGDGRLAVVGVFFEMGSENPEVDKVLRNVPEAPDKERAFSKLSINPADLLPSDHSYVHYNGSLTTPPCSEGVRWFVMESTIKVSKKQVKKFLSMVGKNARPTQPMNNRIAKR